MRCMSRYAKVWIRKREGVVATLAGFNVEALLLPRRSFVDSGYSAAAAWAYWRCRIGASRELEQAHTLGSVGLLQALASVWTVKTLG